MASKTVEKRGGSEVTKVDPADEPSAEWGWHGSFPRATRVAGVASIIFLLLMLWFTRDLIWIAQVWIWIFIAWIAIGLAMDYRKHKLSWRR